MQLLLAEDDKKLGKMLCHLFKSEGAEIDYVDNGEDALAYSTLKDYDVIILDWMMPIISGVEVCRRLRQSGWTGGIIMMTAKDTTADTVFGLNIGADDYVIKPVEFDELLARVRAVQRRGGNGRGKTNLAVGDILMDVNAFKVMRGNEELKLTQKEFKILELLMINAGQTIPRDIIFDRIWNNDTGVMSNTLDVYIRMLRSKLDRKGKDSIITTVRGIGYRLEIGNV